MENSFTNTGFVEGVGNSQNIQTYNFSLTGLPIENYVFRLKQIDFDGSFSYSQSIELSLADKQDISLGRVFPNPTASHASVELKIAQTQKLSAQVIDMQGRVVDIPFQGSVRGNTVINLDINLDSQPAGMYLLRIKGTHANIYPQDLPQLERQFEIDSGKNYSAKASDTTKVLPPIKIKSPTARCPLGGGLAFYKKSLFLPNENVQKVQLPGDTKNLEIE